MNEVADITPDHEPISLVREAMERAPDAVACVVVLVDKDGKMWRNSCGHKKQEVLWALTAEIHSLMEE